MKTTLEPFSLELAAVLGTKDSQNRYIFVSPPARHRKCVRAKLGRPATTDLTLAKIEAALDRLDLGTFGLCTHCGDEISLKRLDHDPSVQRCKGCEDGATVR